MNKNEFPGLSSKEFLIMEMLLNEGEMFGLEMVEESAGDVADRTSNHNEQEPD